MICTLLAAHWDLALLTEHVILPAKLFETHGADGAGVREWRRHKRVVDQNELSLANVPRGQNQLLVLAILLDGEREASGLDAMVHLVVVLKIR